MGNEKDDVFQKLRTVKIRPMKVWCDDPTYETDHARAIAGTGAKGVSPAGADIASRLKQLDALKSQCLITETEYAEKRAAILAEL